MRVIAHAVIRHIPAQHIIPYFVVFVAFALPFFGRKLAEGGQFEAVFRQQGFKAADDRVDLRAFHKVISFY